MVFLYRNKHGQLVQSIYKNPSKQFQIAAERFCSKCNQKQRVQFSESYLRIGFSLQKYPFFSFFLEKLFLTYIELEAKEKVLQIMLCFHFRSICLLMLKRQRNTASRSWYKPFFVMSSFFAVKEQKTTSSLRRKCDPFLQF